MTTGVTNGKDVYKRQVAGRKRVHDGQIEPRTQGSGQERGVHDIALGQAETHVGHAQHLSLIHI